MREQTQAIDESMWALTPSAAKALATIDICVQTIIPSKNKAFMLTAALRTSFKKQLRFSLCQAKGC